MKIACPHCQSDQVQPFRVVFEGGTSTSVHHTTGVGIGLGSDGGIGVGLGGAKTTSASMSLLAEKTAPPSKKIVPIASLVIPVAGMIAIGYGQGVLWKLAGTATLGAWLWYAIQTKLWNWREHPKLMEVWAKSWFCHRCGQGFVRE